MRFRGYFIAAYTSVAMIRALYTRSLWLRARKLRRREDGPPA
jgi:hypothetical protein